MAGTITRKKNMNARLLLLMCAALLAGCGDKAKQPEIQGKGLRQYGPNMLARGERVYQANCAVCHGYGGEARPGWQKAGADGKFPPPPLDDNGRAWRLNSSQMKSFIRQGSPAGRGNMPAWEGKLSDAEIDDVVAYTTSLWSDAVYLQWLTGVERQRN